MAHRKFSEKEEEENIIENIAGFGIVVLLLLIIVPILPVILLYKLIRRE